MRGKNWGCVDVFYGGKKVYRVTWSVGAEDGFDLIVFQFNLQEEEEKKSIRRKRKEKVEVEEEKV